MLQYGLTTAPAHTLWLSLSPHCWLNSTACFAGKQGHVCALEPAANCCQRQRVQKTN
jgi:hypothetical protein